MSKRSIDGWVKSTRMAQGAMVLSKYEGMAAELELLIPGRPGSLGCRESGWFMERLLMLSIQMENVKEAVKEDVGEYRAKDTIRFLSIAQDFVVLEGIKVKGFCDKFMAGEVDGTPEETYIGYIARALAGFKESSHYM